LARGRPKELSITGVPYLQQETIEEWKVILIPWPLGVYFILVISLVSTILVVSHILGQRHQGRATGSPFESGIVSEGSAHVRLSVKFYLVAMFFVIFDLESVFIFAWAIAGRELGWSGYLEIVVFIGILAATLVYLWRLGALDWATAREQMPVRKQIV
jgi:NADH-quinone oxidoreductase subunit A